MISRHFLRRLLASYLAFSVKTILTGAFCGAVIGYAGALLAFSQPRFGSWLLAISAFTIAFFVYPILAFGNTRHSYFQIGFTLFLVFIGIKLIVWPLN